MTNNIENEPDDMEMEEDEIISDSTTAENLTAWKELLSSPEAKDFVSLFMEKATVLFGQTTSSKIINTTTNIFLLVVAFACIGSLSYLKLIPEGTTGVLSGIIIGYFFKKG